MSEALNMVYRLFAPFLVVVVIIAGVDLSSGLIKNSQNRQTAISVAYAQVCPDGATPAVPNQSPLNPRYPKYSPNKYIPMPCAASAFGTTVGGMSDPATGCCKATSFQKAGDAKGGGGAEALKGMMDVVKEFLKPKQKTPKTPDNRPPKPVCQNLSVSPRLPLRPGESATLTWTLGGGKPDTIVVTPGVGAVVGFSTRVSPRTSTTYTVTATNERGSAECPKVRVHVGPRDDKGGDDGVFSDTGATNGGGSVDIWSDDNTGNNAAQNATKSTYDDIWNGNKSNTTKDGTESEDYYDFLSTLASDDDAKASTTNNEPADYSEYYYGDGGKDIDFGTFEDVEPSWDNVDLQDGTIGETDVNGLDLGMREDNYEYYDDYDMGDNLAQNTSGLTNEEIYGVWNRPQSPATGGLGLSGGFGGSGSAGEAGIDFSAPVKSESIFARIGRWFKETFCFWCGNNSSLQGIDSENQVAASSIVDDIKSIILPSRNSRRVNNVKAVDNTDKLIKHKPVIVTSPEWDKRSMKVRVVDMGRKLEPLQKNSVIYGAKYYIGTHLYAFMVRGAGEYPVVEIRFKNNKDLVDKGSGISKFVKCIGSDTITLYGNNILKSDKNSEINKSFSVSPQKNTTGSKATPITLKDGEITKNSYYGYKLICGNPKTGGKDMGKGDYNWDGYGCDPKTGGADTSSKTHILKDGKCIKKETSKKTNNQDKVEKKECKTFYKEGEKRPDYCKKKIDKKPKKEQKRKMPTQAEMDAKGREMCNSKGQIFHGVRIVGRSIKVSCIPKRQGTIKQRPKITYEEFCRQNGLDLLRIQDSKPVCGHKKKVIVKKGISEEDVKKKLKAEHDKAQAIINKQKADNARAQKAQAQKFQQAQRKAQQQAAQRAAAQRSAAQRAAQQRQQAQRKPQGQQPPKNWLQQVLARLRGEKKPEFGAIVTKPQCDSFTANKTNINAGDEVTMRWVVKGATKIIITPKVRITEENGEKVAKANPDSSIQYTLIATNNKGEEHRCQTQHIVVAGDTGGGEDPVDTNTCDGAITNLNINTDPNSVNRPECDPEQDDEQCNDDWQGKEIKVKWQVEPKECVTSCKIQLKSESEPNWVDIWTTAGDMKYDLDTEEPGYSNRGLLRETSTFKIKCEDGLGNLKEDSVEARVKRI